MNWRGQNADALIGSMVWESINAVEPRYRLEVSGTKNLSDDIKTTLQRFKDNIDESCADFRASRRRDVQVSIEIVS